MHARPSATAARAFLEQYFQQPASFIKAKEPALEVLFLDKPAADGAAAEEAESTVRVAPAGSAEELGGKELEGGWKISQVIAEP